MLVGLLLFLFMAFPAGGRPDGAGLAEVVVWYLMVTLFFPGITPLMAAFYFFVYLKDPVYNLIGMLAVIALVFLHFIVSVVSAHSHIFIAFGINLLEMVVVFVLLAGFQKYIVLEDG